MTEIWPNKGEPGFPCRLCGVRPDVACRHRPADPSWSMGTAPPVTDNRSKPRPGNGHNFKNRRKIARERLGL